MPSISFAARFRKLAGSRWPRRLLLLLVWTATLGYFAFALVFLTLRYAILPHIADYRGDLEKALGSAFRLPVTVAGIGWPATLMGGAAVAVGALALAAALSIPIASPGA